MLRGTPPSRACHAMLPPARGTFAANDWAPIGSRPNRILLRRRTVEASNTEPDTETETEPTAEADAVEADASTEAEVVAEAEVAAADDQVEAVLVVDNPEMDVAGVAAEEYEVDEAAVAVAVAEAPSVARVYICKHGHRTVSLWSVPETCLRRVKGHICGEVIVPLADAPADAKEKMLNPLKASKKAAKKS